MNKVMKSGAVITAAIAISLAGVSGSFAAEPTTSTVKKVALTPEQKAAIEAAKAQFKAGSKGHF
jgi:beta-lactam-binding protein with PASTA domain